MPKIIVIQTNSGDDVAENLARIKAATQAKLGEIGGGETGVCAHALPHDTFADEARFFSYRRNCLRGMREYGRQIGAISLR